MTTYHNKEIEYNNNQYQLWYWDEDGCEIFWYNGIIYVPIPAELKEDALQIKQNFLQFI